MELVIPSPNSSRGLERGSAKSPEDICLPFKLMVDNLISAWEQGADTVIMPATMGPCRLGEYGELLKVILDQHGYPFNWILLDSVSAIGPRKLKNRLKEVVADSGCRFSELLGALHGVYKIIKEFENLEKDARILCGYEKKGGECRRIIADCRKELGRASCIYRAENIIKSSRAALESIETDESREPLKIILTGEIFTSIDPFGNHYIEERLMDMGISFEKRISIGWWLDNTVVNPFGGYISNRKANPYMPYCIGGYAKETLSEAVRCRSEGFDGIIQVLPSGCMPEIVAKSVFDDLGRTKGLPVLSIIFDEMGGEAGYITRIEAFTDMLERKKKHRETLLCNRNYRNNNNCEQGEKGNVLFRN